MVLESNNNIVLIVIIIFIIFFLLINYNNSCNLKQNNSIQSFKNLKDNFTNKKKNRIKFNAIDNVKYFDKRDSPSDISSIVEEKEISNIEEFNYNFNDIEKLNLNKDSTKLVSFDKVNNDDKISKKFNKLIGKIDNNISTEHFKLIQGTESETPSLNFKTAIIYNNSLNDDTIINNNKYKPYNGNNHRKYLKI